MTRLEVIHDIEALSARCDDLEHVLTALQAATLGYIPAVTAYIEALIRASARDPKQTLMRTEGEWRLLEGRIQALRDAMLVSDATLRGEGAVVKGMRG